MKTPQLRSKFVWGRIIKIGSIRVQIGPIGFYLDRNLSTVGDDVSNIAKTHFFLDAILELFPHQKVTELTKKKKNYVD